jgi:hypothetical protein
MGGLSVSHFHLQGQRIIQATNMKQKQALNWKLTSNKQTNSMALNLQANYTY